MEEGAQGGSHEAKKGVAPELRDKGGPFISPLQSSGHLQGLT